MIPVEYILLGASALLVLSILASKTSEKLGIPVLLLFLLIGMIVGSDGLNLIYFDDVWLAQSIGIVALCFILFDGGIRTDWASVRPVVRTCALLATAGVLLTAVMLGLFAMLVLGFSLLHGLLLGAVVSSTDAAAVFAVLRSKKVSLKGQLKPLLELESGSNDPMAVFLTVSIIFLLTHPAPSVLDLVPIFFSQLFIGVLGGVVMAKISLYVINHLKLEYEGLYSVLSVTFVLLGYSVTTVLGGSGILAVYLMGLIIGNNNFLHRNSLMYFHDGLAWLMQIIMFLTMGLLVFPRQLVAILPAGLMLAVFLMIVARPVSVFIVTALSGLGINEKILVSWVGLRGAVPIILGTFPLIAGVDEGHTIFNLVFFIVVASVILQGTTIPYLARLLGVDRPLETGLACATEHMRVSGFDSEMVELDISGGSAAAGRSILELGLSPGTLIVTVKRGSETFIPGGSTVIEPGDRVLVLAKRENIDEVCSRLGVVRP